MKTTLMIAAGLAVLSVAACNKPADETAMPTEDSAIAAGDTAMDASTSASGGSTSGAMAPSSGGGSPRAPRSCLRSRTAVAGRTSA